MRGWLAGLAVACATLAPLQASALSCLEPSIRRDYYFYKERAETYVLVHGVFSKLRLQSENKETGDEIWTGMFIGHTATGRAFETPFSEPVTLLLPDFSEFTGGTKGDNSVYTGMLQSEPGLVWLEQTANGYKAQKDLCAPLVYTDPAAIRIALRCLTGGWCPKPKD